MLWLLGMILGIALGIFAGLFPGMHPNTIALFAPFFYSIFNDDLTFLAFLVSLGVADAIVNFVPACLIGVPEESSSLSVLPGHRLLIEGKGEEAIQLAILGCLGSIWFSLLLLPLLYFIFPVLYRGIRSFVHLLLIIAVTYLISKEKLKGRAILAFFLAGILGVALDKLPLDPRFALFPVFTGLFGLPVLLLALKERSTFPEQKESRLILSSVIFTRASLAGTLGGILVGLLPGIGPAQAIVISSAILGSSEFRNERSFLISQGAVALSNFLFSILAIVLIGNPRSGIAIVIDRYMRLDLLHLAYVCFLSSLVAGIVGLLSLKLSKFFIKLMKKVNYRMLNAIVAFILVVMVLRFTGSLGLFVLLVATSIGIYANLAQISRSHLMGVLILPTILFFSGVDLWSFL